MKIHNGPARVWEVPICAESASHRRPICTLQRTDRRTDRAGLTPYHTHTHTHTYCDAKNHSKIKTCVRQFFDSSIVKRILLTPTCDTQTKADWILKNINNKEIHIRMYPSAFDHCKLLPIVFRWISLIYLDFRKI